MQCKQFAYSMLGGVSPQPSEQKETCNISEKNDKTGGQKVKDMGVSSLGNRYQTTIHNITEIVRDSI